jgi:hypothetical protein
LAPTPTHHVTHVNGFTANIYIAQSVLNKLNSSNFTERKGARDHVCITFLRACDAKYGDRWSRNHRYVRWEQISHAPLASSAPPARPARTVSAPTRLTTHTYVSCTCPDSCVQCDIGNHHQCRNCPRVA